MLLSILSCQKEQPQPLASEGKRQDLFRWHKSLEQKTLQEIKEYRGTKEQKLEPSEKMENLKGNARKKRGKIVSYSCCQEAQICPAHHTSAVLLLIFQSPP